VPRTHAVKPIPGPKRFCARKARPGVTCSMVGEKERIMTSLALVAVTTRLDARRE
jgi:hypothetical protein